MGSFLSSEPQPSQRNYSSRGGAHSSREYRSAASATTGPVSGSSSQNVILSTPINGNVRISREDLLRLLSQYSQHRGRAGELFDLESDDEQTNDILQFIQTNTRLRGQMDRKCPICSAMIPYDDFEFHKVMCLTTPRVTYNEDVLKAKHDEECAICLVEMVIGDPIARLPCLCIFHKACIDSWFKKKQQCPVHPQD